MASLQLFSILFIMNIISLCCANVRVKRIVGGRPAAIPPKDDPVAFVYFNNQNAKVYGSKDGPDGYYNFLGIRYAEPPVGRFRFQRPRKLPMIGDINATRVGPPCPQPDPSNNGITGSEDCLYLNVFTPMLPDSSDGLPVLMWIHGGGYRRGSASQYGVRHLVEKNLVVVTIQYRLGSLGFLSAGNQDLPGNAGMFDMALSLEWIKDYISYFGGNPNKITVFGQGTGASSAILLSLSQITQGFLGGVLAMSGSALSAFAIDHNPLATGRQLAKQNGCPDSPVLEMVKCLQELPVSALIKADSGLQEIRLAAQGVLAGITGLLGPAPCIEGGNDGRFLPNFLPENPLDELRTGKFPNIPLLTGVTRDETSAALLGKFHDEFLNKFKNSPNFLTQFLSGVINSTDLIGRIFNKPEELLQNVASKYFPFLQEDSNALIKKAIEATGDAVFNLPAFQMAKMWSKFVGKTYFYSFETHLNKKNHGAEEFLGGLPIIENNGVENGIGHGDDLPFIFDPHPFTDNMSNIQLLDPDDEKVQNITTHLIAEFARTGEPRIVTEGEQSQWPAFSEDKNNFVTISSNPRPHDNFRFCQMALWGGIFPRLQSATCEALWGITKFSEDALAVVDHALQQGVGRGAIINTVINSTLTGNVGNGAIINAVLNKTLPPKHGIQVGNGRLINYFLNKTLPPQENIQTGNEVVINSVLDGTGIEKSGVGGGVFLNTLNNTMYPIDSESDNKKADSVTDGNSDIDSILEERPAVALEKNNIIEETTSTTTANPFKFLEFLAANRPTLFPKLFG